MTLGPFAAYNVAIGGQSQRKKQGRLPEMKRKPAQ